MTLCFLIKKKYLQGFWRLVSEMTNNDITTIDEGLNHE